MSRLNFKRRRAAGRGFTLVELLTLVAVACLLLNLLLPAVLSSRDKSRRSKCENNLKQLALAAHNYHDVNNALPAGQDACNLGYGFRVSLLPYLEQFALYQGVMYEGFEKGVRFADLDADVKTAQIDVYACHADPGASRIVGGFRPASYVACYGDFCPNVAPYDDAASPRSWVPSRGAIAPKTWTQLHKFTDGTSNTALFSETVVAVPGASTIKNGVATGTSSVFGAGFVLNSCMRPGFKPQVCLTYADGANYRPDVAVYQARGSRWGDGRDVFSAFSTILPPNSPNCSLGGVGDAGGNPQLLSATSHHRGGVNVALVDGSVHFFSETIDCGNLTGSTIGDNAGLCSYAKSPFGVWGALGSRNGGETDYWSALDDAPSQRSLFERLRDVYRSHTNGEESATARDDAPVYSGVVRLDGEPLADAALVFVPTTPILPSAVARSNAKGQFVLQTLARSDVYARPDVYAHPGVQPGEYNVVAVKNRAENGYTEEELAIIAQDRSPQDVPHTLEELFPDRPAPVVISELPERYNDAETSGLTIALPVGGATNLRVELSSSEEE